MLSLKQSAGQSIVGTYLHLHGQFLPNPVSHEPKRLKCVLRMIFNPSLGVPQNPPVRDVDDVLAYVT